jgi:hypothetical protein
LATYTEEQKFFASFFQKKSCLTFSFAPYILKNIESRDPFSLIRSYHSTMKLTEKFNETHSLRRGRLPRSIARGARPARHRPAAPHAPAKTPVPAPRPQAPKM